MLSNLHVKILLVSQSSLSSRQLFVAQPCDQPFKLEARHLTYSVQAEQTKVQRRFTLEWENDRRGKGDEKKQRSKRPQANLIEIGKRRRWRLMWCYYLWKSLHVHFSLVKVWWSIWWRARYRSHFDFTLFLVNYCIGPKILQTFQIFFIYSFFLSFLHSFLHSFFLSSFSFFLLNEQKHVYFFSNFWCWCAPMICVLQ